jgi:hypothetical protein
LKSGSFTRVSAGAPAIVVLLMLDASRAIQPNSEEPLLKLIWLLLKLLCDDGGRGRCQEAVLLITVLAEGAVMELPLDPIAWTGW